MQGILSVQSGLARVKCHKAATFRFTRLLVTQHVQLVDAAVLLEHGLELGLAHITRDLTDKHFDGVRIGLFDIAVVVAVAVGRRQIGDGADRRCRISEALTGQVAIAGVVGRG